MCNIILLEESLPSLKMLSNEEAGALLKALIAHTEGEEPVELPDKAMLLFPFVVGQMDRMNNLRERRAAAGRVGGSKTQANAKQNASKSEANLKQSSSKLEANVKQTKSKCEAPIPIPIPIIEREREKKEKVDLPDTGIWADTEVRDAFKDYAKMRVRIKKSMTPEAVKRKIPQLERLASTAQEALDIIHTATDNCWLDFYAPRDRQKQKPESKPAFNFTARNTDYDALLNSMGV